MSLMPIKWKVHPGQVFKYHNIYVVYTKEAETADAVHRKDGPSDESEISGDCGDFRCFGTGDHSLVRGPSGYRPRDLRMKLNRPAGKSVRFSKNAAKMTEIIY